MTFSDNLNEPYDFGNFGTWGSEDPHLEQLAAKIRTDELSDFQIVSCAAASLFLAAQFLGEVNAEVFGNLMARLLVDKSGLHRRHFC